MGRFAIEFRGYPRPPRQPEIRDLNPYRREGGDQDVLQHCQLNFNSRMVPYLWLHITMADVSLVQDPKPLQDLHDDPFHLRLGLRPMLRDVLS